MHVLVLPFVIFFSGQIGGLGGQNKFGYFTKGRVMEQLSILKAALLGALQGATEFLPVSSSGHLVIAQDLLHVKLENGAMLAFDVCLHVGTLLAVIIVFWRDILDIAASFFRKPELDDVSLENAAPEKLTVSEARRLFIYLVIGTVPAGIAGLAFKDFFEGLFTNPLLAGVMLLVTGTILFGTRYADGREVKIVDMRWWQAAGVGIAQAIAIIPGISRSGSTIAGGLYLGLERKFSARFAFLLAVPAIAGAAVLQIKDFANLSGNLLISVAIGTAVSVVVGFVCVKWMLKIVSQGHLSWFAYYCWTAGLAFIVYKIVG